MGACDFARDEVAALKELPVSKERCQQNLAPLFVLPV